MSYPLFRIRATKGKINMSTNPGNCTCPSCGDSAIRVGEILPTLGEDEFARVFQAMQWRVFMDRSNMCILLVDTAANEPVLAWTPDQAADLRDEVLGGPASCILRLETNNRTFAEFTGLELCVLAAALDQNVVALVG